MKSAASLPLIDVHAGRHAVIEEEAEDPVDLDGDVDTLAAFLMPNALVVSRLDQAPPRFPPETTSK